MTDAKRTESPEVVAWQQVCSPDCAELRAAAAGCEPRSAAAIAGLRKRWPAALVTVALELTRARDKARRKFPDAMSFAGDVAFVADVAGVEQGTSQRVARHKGARFSAARINAVHDFCCGIGGDALELSRIAAVHAVDADPVRAWMCQHNLQQAGGEHSTTVSVADVTDFDCGSAAVHIDPSRREEAGQRRRAWHYRDYRPDPTFLEQLVERQPAVAIKLGPGVDFAELPQPEQTEIELISDRGTLVQAVLWSGALVQEPGTRSATLLLNDSVLTVRGRPATVGEMPVATSVEPARAWLFEPDAALERAQLLAQFAVQHGLSEVAPGLGLLTGSVDVQSPWCTSFRVAEVLPWREGRVRRWLADHGAGIVEVKTRGGVADANALQRSLRGAGSVPYTLFVLRTGQKKIAMITRRIDPAGDESTTA
ncbi:MAG: class I SAM-dependent methyltransferase [Planctomycetota bacterium]